MVVQGQVLLILHIFSEIPLQELISPPHPLSEHLVKRLGLVRSDLHQFLKILLRHEHSFDIQQGQLDLVMLLVPRKWLGLHEVLEIEIPELPADIRDDARLLKGSKRQNPDEESHNHPFLGVGFFVEDEGDRVLCEIRVGFAEERG